VSAALIGLAVLALLLAGCSSAADSESLVPRNVLPEQGSPVIYEFYTDT
jgi:hypothetical protein